MAIKATPKYQSNMNRILLTAMAGTLFAACSHKQESSSTPPLPVAVETAEVRDVTLTREYPGYLSAEATVAIVARVNGTLIKKNYTPGRRVKRGDILFEIEPTTYQNEVTQAQAALSKAEAGLDYALSNYERMLKAEKSNAVSRIEVIQAQTNVATGRAAVSTARAALSTAATNLDYCLIRAPHDGLMTLADYSVGSYIAGAASPVQLGTLYKDDTMYAYFDVTDNQWLRQQQRIDAVGKEETITFSLGEDKYFTREARMDYLSPNVDLSTGTLRVRAELPNNDHFLKPGSYISVILPYEKATNAILARDASIGTDQLGNYLYVVNDSNIVEYRHIETGNIVDDTMRLVRSGLRPHERYVSKALMKVRGGQRITPVTENPEK